MKRGIGFLFLFFMAVSVGRAQKSELGKVSVEELAEKRHPADQDATAAVLFNKGHSYMKYTEKDGFSLIHEVKMRIKIYTKDGLKYANQEIPFYVGYENLDKDQLRLTDAVTYNLVDGKIEKTKAGGDARIYNQKSENWKTATIVMPNVREGSVIEFRYELRSQNIQQFPDFVFQHDIPVNFVEYVTELPNLYVYKTLLSGFIPITADGKYEEGNQNYTNEYGQTRLMNYNQLRSVYTGRNIPALAEEEYVDNRENYRSKLSHELELVRYDGKQPDKDLSRTWEGVTKRIYDDRDIGGQLKEIAYFENDLRRIVAGITDAEGKMKTVFAFVRDRMNWDGKLTYWTSKALKQAYADRTGSSGEINLMMCSMMKMAGVEANPVLLSTISNGIAAYPNITAFNHVIVAADVDGQR